jgi:hypothetical protein
LINEIVLQDMFRAIRSYFAALKASRLFGRASRLRDAGRMEESMNMARQSLAILRAPWVVRNRPAEGSVLLSTTMLVEQVASELNRSGAEEVDVADALAYLKILPPDSVREIFGTGEWASYLDSRLRSKGPGGAA